MFGKSIIWFPLRPLNLELYDLVIPKSGDDNAFGGHCFFERPFSLRRGESFVLVK